MRYPFQRIRHVVRYAIPIVTCLCGLLDAMVNQPVQVSVHYLQLVKCLLHDDSSRNKKKGRYNALQHHIGLSWVRIVSIRNISYVYQYDANATMDSGVNWIIGILLHYGFRPARGAGSYPPTEDAGGPDTRGGLVVLPGLKDAV